MATRIRTLNFLPEIFKTPTNSQFLNATLDQIVDQPNTKKIEGYVGSKFGYGVNAKNYYVTEPTKTRTDYQLDPGVVFLKKDTSTAQDFISYPGIIDGLELEGGVVNDNNRLFTSQFYSWDSFTNLDKIINFTQYYWIPEGPEAVTVSTETVYNATDYIVTDTPNGYLITPVGQSQGTINPSITLLQGGTYTFSVNQNSNFWIQGAPGITGFDPIQPNIQTRDVFGVDNNGAEQGVVTFTVPFKNAQDEYNFPGNNRVDVVSTLTFDQVNGVLVSSLSNGIDGITSLDGLTLMFYNDTGTYNSIVLADDLVVGSTYTINTLGTTDWNVVAGTSSVTYAVGDSIEVSAVGTGTGTAIILDGYISKFYDTTLYDEAGGDPYVPPGTTADFINYEGGFYTDLSATFYTITYEGEVSNPVIRLVPAGTIPVEQKITANYGTEWIGRSFYRSTTNLITLIPYISSILDILYYQDGTSSNKVGQIKIIASNTTNRIDVLADILGKKNYTSPNGVVFTNGLKVIFSGEIYPSSYENVSYYVEGVGTAIQLISVTDLIAPEPFTSGTYIPYDTTPYDIGNYDSNLYIPVTPDYITIARNSIDKNAWSRSNRWFHIDVINATATYNNAPELATLYATQANKAKRPIIEFYPNLRMFNAGVIGKDPIDFIDFRTSDALNYVAGQENYYPDVEVYTAYTADINGSDTLTAGAFVIGDEYKIVSIGTTDFTLIGASSNTVGETFTATGIGSGTGTAIELLTSTTIDIPTTDITGGFQIGQYVTDMVFDGASQLPASTQITAISAASGVTTLTVEWIGLTIITTTIDPTSLAANDQQNDSYSLFEGARIVFAGDTDLNVRNKIYVVRFSTLVPGSEPIITLTEATDGSVLVDEQTVVFRGYNYQGMDFHFDGIEWIESQQKTTVNQPPLFDIFDDNEISFGNSEIYVGTSFAGNKLFSYSLGYGLDDPILGFSILYSSIDNVGDISFDVSLNSATFNYVNGTTPINQKVNTGYVYDYTNLITPIRQLGWQTAIAPSVQYQIFEFKYYASNPTTTYTCDIAKIADTDSAWPTIQLFVNNQIQPYSDYEVTTTATQTIVTFTVPDPLIDTVIEISLLSDQVSTTAYYSIPINLNNNPFNADVTKVNVGDIRGQYQSIFYNNPDTTGEVFGSNNYRDLGNLVPYGNKIIQNSASLVLPGTFLRKQNHNLFNALLYNSREYITFKTLLVDTVNSTDYTIYMSPSQMLDDALDQITKSKIDSNSFFWSDMLPNKAAYVSNTYSFANALDTSIYPLTKIYNFATANYNGVLVYLTNSSGVVTQLIRGVDYTVSTDSPSLTVTLDLAPGDQITIKEYNQTYGSYVPNTPTKLGLYPATIPTVVLDSNYKQPTYFIVGHDGSYNKLYGDYINGKLIDFRDQVLLEYEKRVYNNLKLSNTIPIQEYEVLPGFFRDTDYSYDEFLQIYSSSFLNWVGQNRINYKTQFYNASDEYSYNYNQSGNKINNQVILQGYWRGIYQYFYDTSQPDVTPWAMLGFANQPTWWETRYGPAPYTSDNLVLWDDLAQGIDWNNGDPVVIPNAIRPELLQVLPVDSAGNLVSPFDAIVGNYSNTSFNRDWKVGDVGPAEFSYRRSSSWPFDLMRILALTKPAEFFNLGVDIDNYKYNEEFNQYLVNNRSHLVISDVEIYGNGIAKTSYINWIVDYEKQVGIDATTNITDLLDNLDVRLVYRLAGFSDKNLLKFYVEKSTANSNNSSLLIPDESYQVLLYDNQPFDRIVYSGVVVQLTDQGYYKVYGNSQTTAYFNVLLPKINGNYDRVSVQSLSVQLAKDYYTTPTVVAYGTEFYSVQEVAQFLESYGRYLISQGVLFDQIESGLEVSWRQMVAEYLYWAQSGWEPGSIVNINPASNLISINKDSYIVQPLTLQQQNFVLNQNLYPIQSVDLSIVRDGTVFTAQPLNQGDTIAYGQFNISNFEHGIVFDNVTLFDDVIYNLTTGLRQNRINLRGTKTAEWNGTIDAQGFILNQDNILDWSKEVKYTTGSIVKYKNKYWIAITIIQAKEIFDERDWKETDYNEIQKGLLPNTSTRSYESTLYYDVNRANLENDADLLSFSLIGYRPRDYLALVDLTDITQINVYKNFIKNKGTLNAVSAFKGANLPQGGIDYDIYENWAIKSGEFGGVLNSNFIDFKLNQNVLTGNPSIVGLTNGASTDGVQQEVPLYSLYNYGRPVTSVDVLPLLPTDTPTKLFPDAGYANFNDMRIAAYYYSNLPTSTSPSGVLTPISKLYVGQYIWLADYRGTWNVMTPVSLGQVIFAKNNLNGTATIVFNTPHNLSKYQPFAIINFNVSLNGYYIANTIIDTYSILVNVTLDPTITSITGQGVGFIFQSQRVANTSDIINLPLLNTEFVKNKVWVDTNSDGDWAVYRKSINYGYDSELTKTGTESFGSAVAYTNSLGYLVGDADAGNVYRYSFNELFDEYILNQTISAGPSFGTTIAYADDIFVISQPTGATSADRTVNIYQLVINLTVDALQSVQVIQAPTGVTEWGKSVAISGDKNWIYISTNIGDVYAYNLSTATSTYVYAGIIASPNNVNVINFEVGVTYKITNLGTTSQGQWNIIAGTSAIVYVVNDTFTCVDIGSSSGTGTAYPLNDYFGNSISTDYYSDTVVIGAPNQNYNSVTDNWGYTYVFDRTIQSLEAQYTSIPSIPQTFVLAWSPTTITQTATATTGGSTDSITVSSTTGFKVNDPVIFSGTLLSNTAIFPNVVYYVKTIVNSTSFTISATISGSTVNLTTDSGSMTVIVQSTMLTVTLNGTVLANNNYAVIGSTLNVYNSLTAGDILTVGANNFVLMQTLTTETTPKVGVQFGISVDTNTHSSEILVGAPFELTLTNQEGAVYRYTNGGRSYGIVIGTTNCYITADRIILINGYIVTLPVGGASTAANAINQKRITNVQASEQLDIFGVPTGKLIINIIDNGLSSTNNKLSISTLATATWAELGFAAYTQTQTINDPHIQGTTQFGNVVKFNEFSSFIVSAPTATRYVGTTFDSSDDENYDNDTLFDNNATQWVDTYKNAGAVYMFDYLSVYNESLTNCGTFVYAQSVNAINETYGSQPMYGHALEFNASRVVVGTPNFKPDTIAGQIVTYSNPIGQSDWAVYRSSTPVVDINRIQDIQLYSALTNTTLDNLDYIDPLQGKILGSVRQNIDVVSNEDPAGYNSPDSFAGTMVWGATQVGQIWFNTSTTRFVNYHQNDVVYNSKWWGQVFPGSDITIYSWITSNVIPINYAGPGTPYDINSYAIEYTLNATGVLTPVYYYWVRNTNIIFTKTGKTLSDGIIQSYIASPINSGISYFAPLDQNIYALYNCASNINANDTVLHVGYSTGTNDDVSHSVYNLIRTDYPDDFLPGLPGTGPIDVPESLYDRMLDSLCGVDEAGGVVPDPYLPKPVQYGIYARPRQSFFVNRFLALKNYLTYANEILAQYPITETRRSLFLFTEGVTNRSTDPVYNTDPTSPYYSVNPWTGPIIPFYNTTDYWTYINWWATGYDDNTKSAFQVPTYSSLATIDATAGLIVTVTANGDGKSETYVYTNTNVWERIGLQDGTIEFSINLWDYQLARLGFGDNFFDTTPYDTYPSQETRSIVRALNEEIYTNELLIYRNKSLILLFEFIQSETIESQNYLPWLNKTSFIDVAHTIRELRPIEVFQTDNQDFLAGYINEVKPYHVVIKEFLFKYTGTDVYSGNITDFDLPAQYDTTIQQFITPELVYANPSSSNQFLPTDPIWQTAPYSEWFNNYGLSITGVDDYQITILASYISLNSFGFAVDNAFGFPINGTVLIGDELIGYSSVNRANNTLSGLTRGINGTPISVHLPGETITIDLPAILLLNGGRGYTETPKITAYIDTSIYPEPRILAEFQAVMNLDSILSVTVINPGDGYAVLPEIIIDPAISITFTADNVNTLTNTILLPIPLLQTGDLIKYTIGSDTTPVGGLATNQYYYVNVLESTPTFTIALYTTYKDAINDSFRVALIDTGTGTNNILNLGGRASCVSTSVPIRENKISLRFDRTSYTSQVTDWQSGDFYGSYYAGLYNNSARISSSSLTLSSTEPNVNTILASSQGAVFEIEEVANNQVIDWSSLTRNITAINTSTNVITLTPFSSTEPNASGSTIGFYVGMPVKFAGAVTGNIVIGTTYYITEVVSETQFKINLSMAGTTVGSAGLTMSVGEITNTATITLFYPGILTATATTSAVNTITVPTIASGKGGTSGFYPNLPIYFTGNVFGGVIENEPYYVTTVVDGQTFTMSKSKDPLVISVTATDSATDTIICTSTLGLSINDPIIFNNMLVNDAIVFSFGGLTDGVTYYVSAILNNTTFQVSAVINGSFIPLSTQTAGSTTGCNGTDQNNVVQLTTSTGSMTCISGLPVSPGQINGQLLSFFSTSSSTYTVSGVDGNLVERTLVNALATGNYLSISTASGGLTNMYINMPIKVANTYSSLTAGTTYWVIETGTVTTEVTSTTAGNLLTCSTTAGFYKDMPISFTGTALGGSVLDTTYYVIESSITSTQFKLSTTPGGSEIDLTADSGATMYGTGYPYIKVSTSPYTSPTNVPPVPVTLTTDYDQIIMTQAPASTPTFNVAWVLGGYTVTINTINATSIVIGKTYSIAVLGTTNWNTVAGTSAITYAVGDAVTVVAIGTGTGKVNAMGYTIDNTITIPGNLVGGATPLNDLTLTVTGIDTIVANPYNQFVPLESNGNIDIIDIDGNPNDIEDQYYLKVISASECEVYSDPLLQIPVSGIDFPFIAGEYIVLPEPFYFNQSIVKYNNRVYQCVISNNDSEFIFGKWELVSSDDRRLNALDRITGFYQPTVNMPGLDLTQLVDGITYPNSTYLGNAFAPADEITLDTDLQDRPFTNVVPTVYDVQGDPFTAGYGPEELVPGVVTDNLTMIVTTRPGTTWDDEIYQHVGYNVVSAEFTPTVGQTIFSFYRLVQSPAQLSVFQINGTTGLSTRLYSPTSFTVNWIDKTVTLTSSLPAGDTLSIEVYEVGNGDQLEKSNSQTDPIRVNTVTGFNEIYLNCNYSASLSAGSGVVRPNTEPITVLALETDSTNNTILCDNVTDFVIDDQIIFNGPVFGNIVADTPYYVKTVSTATQQITISETSTGGVAGSTFAVLTASGSMDVVIESGSGTPWTDPIVYHNGNRLVRGHVTRVTQTNSSTNSITCTTTNGISVGNTVVFSDTMFGNFTLAAGLFVIGNVYKILTVGTTNFTLIGAASNTVGTIFTATGIGTGTGTAMGGIIPQQTYYVKTIVDGNEFTISTTLGGAIFALINSAGGAVAITNDYAFDIVSDRITAKLVFAAQYDDTVDYLNYTVFGETTPVQYGYTVPETQIFTATSGQTQFTLTNYASGDNPTNAVVEVNGIRLNSGYTINSSTSILTLSSGATLNSKVAVTTYHFTERQSFNTQYNVTGNIVSSIAGINNTITTPIDIAVVLETYSGSNLLRCSDTNQFIVNQTIIFQGTAFGNVLTDGTVYYVKTITFPYDGTFTISSTLGGSTVALANGTGTMVVQVGGQPAVRVTTATPHGLLAPVADNDLIRIDGTQGSVQLNNNSYYVHVINSTQFDLYEAPYLPGFTDTNYPVTNIGTYTSGGYAWESGTFIVDSDWEQSNVDRLWVTVNGYRVPSSSLYLNANNVLSILTPITTGDVVIITSMISSATPNQQVYLQNVNKNGTQTVYRANTETRTWLVEPLYYTDETIYVNDITRVTDSIVQNVTAPAAVGGIISIGLTADRRIISQVIVYNVTTSSYVNPANYEVVIIDIAPILQITSGVTAGNNLIITTIEGNLIYINGEQIRFTTVDLDNNTLTGLQRGMNGTGEQAYLPTYTEVYGILSNNLLPDVNYNLTWNSYVYNAVEGDPLQISETTAAYFLNMDVP